MRNFVVCDAGPLISLEKIPGGFAFMQKLYGKILVPEAVLGEVAYHYASPADYLWQHKIEHFLDVRIVQVQPDLPGLKLLDEGEKHALSLAKEVNGHILIEEKYGRRSAQEMGLRYSGIAGQVMKAVRLGVLSREDGMEKIRLLYEASRIPIKIFNGCVQKLAVG